MAAMWFLFDLVFPQAPDTASTEPGAALLGARVATAILLAPVVEELAFRRISSAAFDQIFAHATTNAALVVAAWMTGTWDLWK